MSNKNVLIRSKLKRAEAFLQQNDLAAATQLYEKACQMGGASADLWSRLGVLKRLAGDFAQAEACCRKAVQLAPETALTHYALGTTLHAQHRLDEALVSYRHALRLQPGHVDAQYELANALREKGELDAAVEAYQALLRLDPDHFAGLNNFGALLTNMERAEEARQLLTQALQRHPDSVETLHNLARAHVLAGSHAVAIQLLEQVLCLRPTFTDAYIELAHARRMEAKYSEAMASFDTALQLEPGNRAALIGKAKIHELLGQYQEAFALLDPLVETARASDALPVFFDLSRHVGQRERAVSLILATLARTDINRHALAPLHFRLGNHFDREHDYAAAFVHFAKANRLCQRRFDIDMAATQFEAIRDTYSSETVDSLPRSENASRLPVFIVGMPRSGTSLVEQILASHPDVYGAGETDKVRTLSDKLAARLSTHAFPDFVNRLSGDVLAKEATELLRDLSATAPIDAARITDKTPQNFIYIGLILQLFPDCTLIHCRRNPLDTCVSCWSSEFGSHYHNYTYDLSTLGRYYGLYAGLMNHWTSLYPGRILEVNYEELVDDQEAVSRDLIDHCGLEWSDRCLQFHKLDRVVNTISYDQVRQPIYRRSVNRWRNYDKHLEPLREALDEAGVGVSY